MSAQPSPTPTRAIDRLRKAANFEPIRQRVVLENGDEFVFYVAPLTAAEREKAQKDAASDSANDFALQLICQKALDENGERLFKPGEIPDLKREVEDEDVQKLMMCVLRPRTNDNADPDTKRNRESA
jgi:hypothetical protein